MFRNALVAAAVAAAFATVPTARPPGIPNNIAFGRQLRRRLLPVRAPYQRPPAVLTLRTGRSAEEIIVQPPEVARMTRQLQRQIGRAQRRGQPDVKRYKNGNVQVRYTKAPTRADVKPHVTGHLPKSTKLDQIGKLVLGRPQRLNVRRIEKAQIAA